MKKRENLVAAIVAAAAAPSGARELLTEALATALHEDGRALERERIERRDDLRRAWTKLIRQEDGEPEDVRMVRERVERHGEPLARAIRYVVLQRAGKHGHALEVHVRDNILSGPQRKAAEALRKAVQRAGVRAPKKSGTSRSMS